MYKIGVDLGGTNIAVGIIDEKFNIVLRPATPAFALQLSYMSDEITNRINKYFGYDAVGKISFKK